MIHWAYEHLFLSSLAFVIVIVLCMIGYSACVAAGKADDDAGYPRG